MTEATNKTGPRKAHRTKEQVRAIAWVAGSATLFTGIAVVGAVPRWTPNGPSPKPQSSKKVKTHVRKVYMITAAGEGGGAPVFSSGGEHWGGGSDGGARHHRHHHHHHGWGGGGGTPWPSPSPSPSHTPPPTTKPPTPSPSHSPVCSTSASGVITCV